MSDNEGLKGVRMGMEEADRGDARIRLDGVLDRESVPDLRKRLLRVARQEGLKRLFVDFSGVERMDTAGVAVMVELLQAVSARGGVLSVEGLSEESTRLFRLACLDRTFCINDPSEAEA